MAANNYAHHKGIETYALHIDMSVDAANGYTAGQEVSGGELATVGIKTLMTSIRR